MFHISPFRSERGGSAGSVLRWPLEWPHKTVICRSEAVVVGFTDVAGDGKGVRLGFREHVEECLQSWRVEEVEVDISQPCEFHSVVMAPARNAVNRLRFCRGAGTMVSRPLPQIRCGIPKCVARGSCTLALDPLPAQTWSREDTKRE